MKLKCIRLIVLAIIALFLVACAPLNSSLEERQNRLEAFLINRANGYNDVKAPNIYGLSDDEKKEVINGLSHDVVMGTESVLIDYLNEQWPAWRSADGFMLQHLHFLVSQTEKDVQKMPQQEVAIKQITTVADLNQFYVMFDQLLNLYKIDRNSLYVVNDSLVYDWNYRNAVFALKRVEMSLIDLPAAQNYRLLYENGQISLTTIDDQAELYGHLTLSETIRLVDEKAFLPLMEQVDLTEMSVKFSTGASSAANCSVAVKSGKEFLSTNEIVDGAVIGKVIIGQINMPITDIESGAVAEATSATENKTVTIDDSSRVCYKLIVPVQTMQ